MKKKRSGSVHAALAASTVRWVTKSPGTSARPPERGDTHVSVSRWSTSRDFWFSGPFLILCVCFLAERRSKVLHRGAIFSWFALALHPNATQRSHEGRKASRAGVGDIDPLTPCRFPWCALKKTSGFKWIILLKIPTSWRYARYHTQISASGLKRFVTGKVFGQSWHVTPHLFSVSNLFCVFYNFQ